MFSSRTLAAAAAVVMAVSSADAAYLLTPLSDQQNSRTVGWGESFNLDIVITSDTDEAHSSAIFQVRFTRNSLLLENYQWSVPYVTGDIFDDSTPSSADLPLPVTNELLQGGSYPPNLADVEFSNVLIGSSFTEGTLVRLGLRVPANYGFVGQVFISLNPDQIFNGFDEVPTTAGQVFTLNIIPAPASAAITAMAMGSVVRRRR